MLNSAYFNSGGTSPFSQIPNPQSRSEISHGVVNSRTNTKISQPGQNKTLRITQGSQTPRITTNVNNSVSRINHGNSFVGSTTQKTGQNTRLSALSSFPEMQALNLQGISGRISTNQFSAIPGNLQGPAQPQNVKETPEQRRARLKKAAKLSPEDKERKRQERIQREMLEKFKQDALQKRSGQAPVIGGPVKTGYGGMDALKQFQSGFGTPYVPGSGGQVGQREALKPEVNEFGDIEPFLERLKSEEELAKTKGPCEDPVAPGSLNPTSPTTWGGYGSPNSAVQAIRKSAQNRLLTDAEVAQIECLRNASLSEPYWNHVWYAVTTGSLDGVSPYAISMAATEAGYNPTDLKAKILNEFRKKFPKQY